MATCTYRYFPRAPTLNIVNAGFGGAQRRPGVEKAPTKLLDFGLKDAIIRTGRAVELSSQAPDYLSFKPHTDMPWRGMNNPRWVSVVTKSISQQVYEQATRENQVLTLSGDHSIAIGTLNGTARAVRDRFGSDQRLGVIYVDAHADLNVPEDSESGNIHGMAVAFASGLAVSREPAIFDWITEDHLIHLDKFVYIGLRDADESEKQTIAKRHILTFWMDDVKKIGIHEVIRRSLEYLGDVPIHVSFDIDGIDPTFAPSTGLPVPDGIPLTEAVGIMDAIRESGRLIAMDVVEINPSVGGPDEVHKTMTAAFDVIKAGLGEQR